jgi:oligopeptidase A
VLLPEIPPDTSDDNAIMKYQQTPKFSAITPERCITGCAKLAIQYETQLGNHIDSLRNPAEEKTFSRVFDPIEEVSVPLNTAWRTAKNLNYVAGSEQYRQAFIRVHPQVERAKNERWISETLYYACKEVDANKANLTEYQQRLVSLYLLEGRLNGIELHGVDKSRFIDTLKILAQERSNFRNRVMLTQGMFSHRIDDFSAMKGLPRHVIPLMAEDPSSPTRGPWRVTLQQNVYIPFLEHCSDRLLRWNAWNAFNNRASVSYIDRNLANHKLIEQLRQYRRDTAQLLGYENFAEMSMETKMAGSVENVLNMIDTLKSKFKPVAEQETAELQKFAASHGATEPLQVIHLFLALFTSCFE